MDFLTKPGRISPLLLSGGMNSANFIIYLSKTLDNILKVYYNIIISVNGRWWGYQDGIR